MTTAPTILFIEDDEAFSYAISRLLTDAGFEVIPATDFSTALDVIYSARPLDLLLTDVRMPMGQPHGFALARMARQRRGGLPVLYLTGVSEIPEPEREAAYGKILAKPIDADALIAEIRAQIGRGAAL
jgi:CheY-like chemotaxis protein